MSKNPKIDDDDDEKMGQSWIEIQNGLKIVRITHIHDGVESHKFHRRVVI